MQNSGQKLHSTDLIQLGGGVRLFREDIQARVAAGARLVRFEFCISIVFVTIRRQSPPYLTDSWQSRYLRGLIYSLWAILLGPWGIPWGLIWTGRAVWLNLTGGIDETATLLNLAGAVNMVKSRTVAAIPGS